MRLQVETWPAVPLGVPSTGRLTMIIKLPVHPVLYLLIGEKSTPASINISIPSRRFYHYQYLGMTFAFSTRATKQGLETACIKICHSDKIYLPFPVMKGRSTMKISTDEIMLIKTCKSH